MSKRDDARNAVREFLKNDSYDIEEELEDQVDARALTAALEELVDARVIWFPGEEEKATGQLARLLVEASGTKKTVKEVIAFLQLRLKENGYGREDICCTGAP